MKPETPGRRPLRVLFGSYHCYLDPSSEAALSVRDFFRLLSGRGWHCRVCCGPQFDFEEPMTIAQLLTDARFPSLAGPVLAQTTATVGPAGYSRFDLLRAGIPVTVYDAPGNRPYQPPPRAAGLPFLDLFEEALAGFRPDLLLTYGGDWLAQEVMARARRRGVGVVFWLRTCAYHEAGLFRAADAVVVPSRFAREHYRRTLGLACAALPPPLDWEQVRCPAVEGRYVTFVNPQPDKGVFLFARLATELARRRPDVPLLVVEGRGGVGWLKATGLDCDDLDNLYLMSTTPDARDFYRVSRLVLMPSLWPETFGRVAAEAMVNGIPVLASRRGGLPEVLERAGFLFDVPACYTPESRALPTPAEVAPWVETILRLWDDAAYYQDQSRRCLAAAEAWRPELLAPRYEALFTETPGLSGGPAGRGIRRR
jgi:glycosyltransferase involved in cell wall biosynthesis